MSAIFKKKTGLVFFATGNDLPLQDPSRTAVLQQSTLTGKNRAMVGLEELNNGEFMGIYWYITGYTLHIHIHTNMINKSISNPQYDIFIIFVYVCYFLFVKKWLGYPKFAGILLGGKHENSFGIGGTQGPPQLHYHHIPEEWPLGSTPLFGQPHIIVMVI